MTYHFDQIIDRRGTNSLKFDFAVERRRPADILPLWVADMDFAVPQEVQQALQRAVAHGIFGYTDPKEGYFSALSRWFDEYFGFPVRQEWVVKTPGVVVALALAVKAFTKPGDGVLIQRPVYYPFSMVIEDNGRKVINNPLVLHNGHYEIDFDDFEQKCQHAKLFLLCSPHNPVGRVWTKEELLRMAELCARYDVVICSDEIHCDFSWHIAGSAHTVLSSLGNKIAQRTILCTSAAKTFNLAGLQVSNIIIPNENLRKKFQHEVDGIGYSQANALGLAATQAAYEHGEEWLAQLKAYLYHNIQYIDAFLRENLPQVRMLWPEGTFLVWLDCRELGLQGRELRQLLEYKGKIWLDPGELFGPEGAGFQRINAACPRAVLAEAMARLKTALK